MNSLHDAYNLVGSFKDPNFFAAKNMNYKGDPGIFVIPGNEDPGMIMFRDSDPGMSIPPLGAPMFPSPPGFIPNTVSRPVNPLSLISGTIIAQLIFAGSNLIASHFKSIFKLATVTVYASDGTDPNANLTTTVAPLVVGDVCIGADSGKLYYLSATPSTWTAL